MIFVGTAARNLDCHLGLNCYYFLVAVVFVVVVFVVTVFGVCHLHHRNLLLEKGA